MADKELATVNSSGELAAIQLGGVTANERVLTQDEVNAKIKITDDKVTTNTSNIADNTLTLGINSGRLADHDLDITENQDDIAALEVQNYYEFEKMTGKVINSETYQQVVRLTRPAIAVGTYQIGFAFQWLYDSIIRSAMFRFSLDGGINWSEFQEEPKDPTNEQPFFYSFPKILPGDVIDIILEARCENAADTLTIPFSDVMIERKQ